MIDGKKKRFHMSGDGIKLKFNLPENVPAHILALEEELGYEILVRY